MSGKRTAEPSATSIARSNRQRLAAEEGVRAMADAERHANEVRKNMARLRNLREAKEAADATILASLPPPPPKKRKQKSPR
jgi:hypothetical protein